MYMKNKIIHKKNINAEEKMKELKDAFIDVYEYDSMVLIALFHLQSGETLINLSSEVLEQLKEISADAIGVITSLVQEGIDERKSPAFAPQGSGTYPGELRIHVEGLP